MRLEDNIKGVQHLGIPVLDLDAALQWYSEKLGFRLIQRKLILNPYKTEAAFIELGDLLIELYQPSGREREELRQRGAGILDHFAIDAPNFEECVFTAYQKGMILHDSTSGGITLYENLGKAGVLGVNFTGPNREVIELCHDNKADYRNKKGLLGWAHLAVKVRNLHNSKTFYEKLGFKQSGEGFLDTPDGRLLIVFLSNNGFTLEIIQMAGQGLKELETRGEGNIDHIALDVVDIQEAFWAVKKAKLPQKDYIIKELSLLERGVRFFTILGPDGEKIELTQKQ